MLACDFELAAFLRDLAEQAGILNRQCRLRGERLEQRDLIVDRQLHHGRTEVELGQAPPAQLLAGTRSAASRELLVDIVEPSLEGDEVPVAPGTALAAVAQACGTTAKELELLNPELRAARTPPSQDDWPVRVPHDKAGSCSSNLARVRKEQAPLERYVVRFGESLDQIAQARKVSVGKLVELNGITQGEVVRGGTVLIVPKGEPVAEKPADPKKVAEKPEDLSPLTEVERMQKQAQRRLQALVDALKVDDRDQRGGANRGG